jgi:hypothetical protein
LRVSFRGSNEAVEIPRNEVDEAFRFEARGTRFEEKQKLVLALRLAFAPE